MNKWDLFQRCRILQYQFSSELSHIRLFATPCTAACQASLTFTSSQILFKLMSIQLVMPSNHLILCCPLLLLPSGFPSIRVFFSESVLCIRWQKFWSFSFSISPSNEYSRLISFRIDWLDLLAVQGTLKSILQHHSSKASILWHSAFFTVQLSHPYVTTGQTIVLSRWTFVGKVMSLLFNMLSRLVVAFLPSSMYLSISLILQNNSLPYCWGLTVCLFGYLWYIGFLLVWKGQSSFQSKERQCQRMFKLLHNCTHLTR